MSGNRPFANAVCTIQAGALTGTKHRFGLHIRVFARPWVHVKSRHFILPSKDVLN